MESFFWKAEYFVLFLALLKDALLSKHFLSRIAFHSTKTHLFDPLGQPTVKANSNHYFHMRPCIYVCTWYTIVPKAKQNNFLVEIIFATGVTIGLAERIIDDPYPSLYFCRNGKKEVYKWHGQESFLKNLWVTFVL